MRDRIRVILEYGVTVGAVYPSELGWMVATCPSPRVAREHVAQMRRYRVGGQL